MHTGLTVDRDGDVALLRMGFGKANAMTPEVLGALQGAFAELSTDGTRAIVLTGDGRVFCAGLALPGLVDLERGPLRTFLDLFGATMRQIFACGRPVIAALDGHAIAGGCVLALQADVRLAADVPARIGLNEVQLGLGLPSSVLEPLRLQVPAASIGPIALEGRLFSPREALVLGLVDEVLPTDGLLKAALHRAHLRAALPPAAYAQVKAGIRAPALEAWDTRGAAETERWLDAWYGPETQARLRTTVATLTKR